jgi:LysM repeat protein
MAAMGTRGSFALFAAALAALALVACGGGGGGDGGQGERVTDPAEVPSSTPISNGAPQKYEIHQDGGVVISGGPAVTSTLPPSGTPAGGPGTYAVQSGDTCGSIAEAHGITADALIAANRAVVNEGCTNLVPGDELKIPGRAATATPRPNGGATPQPTARSGGDTYTVESGDTCSDIAASFGVSVEDLIEVNDLSADCTDLEIGQVLQIPG